MLKSIITILFVIIFSSCSKKEQIYEPTSKKDGYTLYQEAFVAFEKGDLFAQKVF